MTQPLVVAIDSQILLWGFRSSDQDDAGMVHRSRALFAGFDDQEARVIVPAVALSEVLTRVPASHRATFTSTMSQHFVVAPFDARAAAIAAELYNEAESVGLKKGNRQILRADTLIIASAAAHGAKVFYSHDEKCRQIAAFRMEAADLPTHDENMFRDLELDG